MEKHEELEEFLFPVIKSLDGVEDIIINDYNEESIDIMVYIDKKTIKKGLRSVSGKIRKAMNQLGLKKYIRDWEAPIRKKDQWGYVTSDTKFFYIDLWNNFNIKADPIFTEDCYTFDNNNMLGSNNKDLERIFTDTYPKSLNVHEHIKIMSERYEFGDDDYDFHTIYKFQHGNEIQYELSPLNRWKWESTVAGMIIIKSDSETNPQSIINRMNDMLCDCA